MKQRHELLNLLASQFKLKSYLEIGVQNPRNNFDLVNIEQKIGVDPDRNAMATFTMTSDAFFGFNATAKRTFDLVFIDGLHHAEQVKRDVENSLKVLSPGGFIVLHDCLPDEEQYATVPRKTEKWFGDVYRFIAILALYTDLNYMVVKFDCGCTVIWKKENTNSFYLPGFAEKEMAQQNWASYLEQKNSWPLIDPDPELIIKRIKDSKTFTHPEETHFQKLPHIPFPENTKEPVTIPQAESVSIAERTLKCLQSMEKKMDVLIRLLGKGPSEWPEEALVREEEKGHGVLQEQQSSLSTQEERESYEKITGKPLPDSFF